MHAYAVFTKSVMVTVAVIEPVVKVNAKYR